MTRQGSPSNMMAMPRRILVAVIGIALDSWGKRSTEHSLVGALGRSNLSEATGGWHPAKEPASATLSAADRDLTPPRGVLNEQMRVNLTRWLLPIALGAGCRTAHSAAVAHPAVVPQDTLLPGMPPPLDPNNIY